MRFIYGPVPSRRLGLSLGVDLVPKKTCSYDCIYCQLGRTTNKTIQRDIYIPDQPIIREIEEYLDHMKTPVDYITFSGSGEPTLHSRIGSIIGEIKGMTSIPVAVITNGSLLFMDEVKGDLSQADLVIPSLDAVSRTIYETINRPEESLEIDQVIQGMVDFRAQFRGQIWVEVLYCRGVNDDPSEITKMKTVVEKINPTRIQLNTVYRPPAEDFASPLTEERLKEIQEDFGSKASIIAPYRGDNFLGAKGVVETRIINALNRRPLTAEDMAEMLGLHPQEIIKHLKSLLDGNTIRYRLHGRKTFYEIAS
ncbi:MAG: radical SAM protein [Syntrophobacterales bacterium]|nr:MAG: radical SAM protein [Syntrophobacterales bacterium]